MTQATETEIRDMTLPVSWWARYMALADTDKDDDEARLKHRFLILMGSLMGIGGLVWGITCGSASLWLASTMPFGYTVLTIVNFAVLARYKNYRSARFVQVTASILLPFSTQWMLGGANPSGTVMYWGMVGLIGALSFEEVRASLRWLALFLVLALVSAYLEHARLLPVHEVLGGATLSLVLLTSTFIVVSSAIFVFTWYFVRERHHALETLKIRNEQLQISEREAEAASRREAQANEAKSRFLAMVSHEIRTPLNGVIGLTSLALGEANNPRQRKHLSDVLSSADNLLKIINDLLDFSKIEAGKLELERVEFGLDKVLDDVARIAGPLAAKKGVEFVLQGDVVSDHLVGDPTRLGQAILNLVSNAIKFTAEGEVLLRAKVGALGSGRVPLEISVRDTGPGIDAETQKRLFSPFTQADESTTRRFGGTGLGLSITKNLIETMGGRISLESVPGAGSTFAFEISLPVRETRTLVEPGRVAEGLRALVVDDNESARVALSGYLRDFNMVVDTASSAEEALGRSASERYDLVLADSCMPGIDGQELVARLRADPDLVNTRLVLVAGHGTQEAEAESRRTGVDALLYKPVRPSTLFDTLLLLFSRELGRVEERPESNPTGGALTGLRVLIIEDNDINQEILVGLLERANARTTVASDGAQGVAAVETATTAYDLILMDVQMPVMDGFDATRAIRAFGCKTPIIGVTAHALSESRARCLEAGMNEVITKPIKPDKLFAAIEQAVKLSDDFGENARRAGAVTDSGEAVPDIRSVNTREGVARAGGNARLYRDLLRRFYDGYLAAGNDIAALLARGAWDDARRCAHSLKGVAGNVGAEAAARAAAQVEAVIVDGDTELLDAAVTALRLALNELAEQRPSDFMEAIELDSAEISATDLPRLQALIADANPEALDAFLAMRGGLLAIRSATAVEALGQALEAYDFERASALVRSVER